MHVTLERLMRGAALTTDFNLFRTCKRHVSASATQDLESTSHKSRNTPLAGLVRPKGYTLMCLYSCSHRLSGHFGSRYAGISDESVLGIGVTSSRDRNLVCA